MIRIILEFGASFVLGFLACKAVDHYLDEMAPSHHLCLAVSNIEPGDYDVCFEVHSGRKTILLDSPTMIKSKG